MDKRMGNTRSMGCDIGSMTWNFRTGQISCVNGREERKRDNKNGQETKGPM